MAEVDRITREILPTAGSCSWLLKQSLFTHFHRLLLLPILGLAPGQQVLDVGAGTGALSLDMAKTLGPEGTVWAVDRDPDALGVLERMADRLSLPVRTQPGDAYALPVESRTFDLTIARLLLQHLDKPEAALREMVRSTAPGGRVVVIDVDDATLLVEPEHHPDLVRLYDAIRALQQRRGGDRHIGRRLYHLLGKVGLSDVQVVALPKIQPGNRFGRNPEVEAYQEERFLREREALLAAELLTEEEFHQGIAALRRSFAEDRFVFDVEFLAMGRVPA